MQKRLSIVQLTTDARENWREYHKSEPYFGTAPAALFEGFASLADEVELHVVSCTQRPVTSPEKLAPNIWFHSLLAPKFGWLRTGYQGCIRVTRRQVHRIRPDLVHAHGTERDCAISGVFSGFPNVLTLHGNMRLIARVNRSRPFTYQWLAARLERFTLPRAGGVICLSRYTEEAVAGLAKKTWVVPNAVDGSFFQVQPKPESIKTILCVGQISPRKNQQQLIRALDAIALAAPFRLVFLGGTMPGDPYSAEFSKMVESRAWCSYGGLAGRKELKQHLSSATGLVLPSLEDNCPMVVLEAMAASLPVLAPNVGGVPDLIQDKVNGLLCDPTDLSSIRTGVTRLLTEPTFCRTLAVRARELATNLYHPVVIARRHLEIYREALSKSP